MAGSRSNVPPVPAGIGKRGKAFWVTVQTELEFDARETDLLVEVCRTLDTIDQLSVAIKRDGIMLEGSQGQRVLNSAVPELRQQQAAYARLAVQLNIEGAEVGEGMKSPRGSSASATAKRRWSTAGGF
ncbi:hypothetical protein FB472_1960 [Rhodoglobus vestalii]|uniref:Terminase small subunit n=1 Tax=Rhodoglobus vestalii TaxID=193384 RepID=A0A8H2K7X3_9MICO|nr:hypothetical protein [Rhodoglobus vestalii]TQO20329.1 hypothetical protein FB472_1960 [Rhodoglobus vestalii]